MARYHTSTLADQRSPVQNIAVAAPFRHHHGGSVTRAGRSGWLASVLIYVVVTAWLGRDVLAHLSTGIVHDDGDPLLTATILHWNAWVLPFSERWWQFPTFYPATDALAFSEHLLGLSVVATPIAWLTRDPLLTANLVTLLTFPLSAAATGLLVHRLTGSAAGAFVAGLAFGFSPYRVSQLPHLQMLASFWAPLALLGLHAYVETARRRWLVVYGVAWLLQSASNGYLLVFFSLFVGFWALWFLVATRRWRALGAVAATTGLAALPLVPILWRYIAAHARHGFHRDTLEVQTFSADLAAVLCAPQELLVWGWLRVACRAEGALFPGVCLAVVTTVGVVALSVIALRTSETSADAARPQSSWRPWGSVIALAVFALAVGAMLALALIGPWRVELAGIRLSTSAFLKPLLVALGAGATALAVSPDMVRLLPRHATAAFYVVAAIVTWTLALGPSLVIMGEVSPDGRLPFGWLMSLPGVTSIRAPARFWMLTTLCLAVVAGMVVARVGAQLARWNVSRAVSMTALAAVAAGLLADGWIDRIPSVPVVRTMPEPALARGRVVLTLPAGDVRDTGPMFEAALGGWTAVNGYSGYEPRSHVALAYGVRAELDDVFRPFQALTELDVVVPVAAPRLTALVERQPGARVVARSATNVHYRLPKIEPPQAVDRGHRWPIERLASPCLPGSTPFAMDDDPVTRWYCGPLEGVEELTADLGTVVRVGAVRHVLGDFNPDFPRALVIETSVDGRTWASAWSGPTVAEVIAGAWADPKLTAAVFAFGPRPARFVRLRQTTRDDRGYWSVPEIDIWSGPARP